VCHGPADMESVFSEVIGSGTSVTFLEILWWCHQAFTVCPRETYLPSLPK